jgi:hypothetical protein
MLKKLEKRGRPSNDLKGQKFGRLTVIERAEMINTHYFWVCACDCGKMSVVNNSYLINGMTASCGCLHRERISERMKKYNRGRRHGN